MLYKLMFNLIKINKVIQMKTSTPNKKNKLVVLCVFKLGLSWFASESSWNMKNKISKSNRENKVSQMQKNQNHVDIELGSNDK